MISRRNFFSTLLGAFAAGKFTAAPAAKIVSPAARPPVPPVPQEDIGYYLRRALVEQHPVRMILLMPKKRNEPCYLALAIPALSAGILRDFDLVSAEAHGGTPQVIDVTRWGDSTPQYLPGPKEPMEVAFVLDAHRLRHLFVAELLDQESLPPYTPPVGSSFLEFSAWVQLRSHAVETGGF